MPPTPQAHGHWPLQRMKASESARLRAESALREELECRWRQLQELDTVQSMGSLRVRRD